MMAMSCRNSTPQPPIARSRPKVMRILLELPMSIGAAYRRFGWTFTYRTPDPDGWMHHNVTSQMPSGNTTTDGAPNAKSVHEECSPEVFPCVGTSARQMISLASMPKLVPVGRATASQMPCSPCFRWLYTSRTRPSGNAARPVDWPRIPVSSVGPQVRPPSSESEYAFEGGWGNVSLMCHVTPSTRPSDNSTTE